MRSSLKSLAIIASAGLTSLAMAAPNGDFSDVKPFPEDTKFDGVPISDEIGVGFLPSWSLYQDLTQDLDNRSATVSIAGSTANPVPPDPFIVGTGVFAFDELFVNYNAYELAQCMPVDGSLDIALSYRMQHNQSEERATNDALRIRLKPYYYDDMEVCNRDLQTGNTGNANSIGYAGARDIRDFSAPKWPANEWHLIDDSVDPDLILSDAPEGTKVLRLTMSMSNRNLRNAGVEEPDIRIWLDDIRVEQEGVNRVVNSDFSHPDLKGGDFLTEADSGWQLALSTRDGISPMASAGALPFALEGEQGFYFKRLTGEYEDSRLVQCISDIPAGDIQPSFSVLSAEPAEGLVARMRAEFFTDNACDNPDQLPVLEGELELRENPGQWQSLQTTDVVGGGQIFDGASIRLTLSAQDQSGGNSAPDSELARTVFMDAVNLTPTLLRPTFSPGGQGFSESIVVTVNGPEDSTLYITMDGTDPDTSSMAVMSGHTVTLTETTELRAVSSDGEALSPVQSAVYTLRGPGGSVSSSANSSSFGCSIGNGATDPILPLLVLLALIGLIPRRQPQ